MRFKNLNPVLVVCAAVVALPVLLAVVLKVTTMIQPDPQLWFATYGGLLGLLPVLGIFALVAIITAIGVLISSRDDRRKASRKLGYFVLVVGGLGLMAAGPARMGGPEPLCAQSGGGCTASDHWAGADDCWSCVSSFGLDFFACIRCAAYEYKCGIIDLGRIDCSGPGRFSPPCNTHGTGNGTNEYGCADAEDCTSCCEQYRDNEDHTYGACLDECGG